MKIIFFTLIMKVILTGLLGDCSPREVSLHWLSFINCLYLFIYYLYYLCLLQYGKGWDDNNSHALTWHIFKNLGLLCKNCTAHHLEKPQFRKSSNYTTFGPWSHQTWVSLEVIGCHDFNRTDCLSTRASIFKL